MTDTAATPIAPELLQAVLDNPYEGTVIVDQDGIIRHFSKGNESIYGITAQQAVGRPILEVIPNSRLPLVAQTGKAEIGEIFNVHGRQVIVNRYPIKKGRKVIGAVGKAIAHNLKALVSLRDRIKELEHQVKQYQEEIKNLYPASYTFDDIVGQSPGPLRAKVMARQLARADSPILLAGESGTGKELYAHAIHRTSPRRSFPFIRINCASIPNELFEAELFGYEPGAFTGASRSGKPGKFELADKGTIFLDEISELALGLQAKLLRVLQEKEIERLGARKPKAVDFRVVAATNRNLEERVREGYFRADLFYRLNVNFIRLPPLREMKEDIPLLVKHFLYKLQGRGSSFISQVDQEVVDIFMNYDWPGNIRELGNVMERAINLCFGERITVEELPEGLLSQQPAAMQGTPASPRSLQQATESVEKDQILAALRHAKGNKSLAAQSLNIHRTTLYYKLRKYGLTET